MAPCPSFASILYLPRLSIDWGKRFWLRRKIHPHELRRGHTRGTPKIHKIRPLFLQRFSPGGLPLSFVIPVRVVPPSALGRGLSSPSYRTCSAHKEKGRSPGLRPIIHGMVAGANLN